MSVREGGVGEFEGMLRGKDEPPELGPCLRRIFDETFGPDRSEQMTDEKPISGGGGVVLSLNPDDQIVLMVLSGPNAILAGVTFDLKGAEKHYDDFGKLLKKIRPQP